MSLNKLLRYCCGYVHFEIEGAQCEQLINLCSDNNIELNELEKTQEGLEAEVISLDYKKVQKFAQELDMQICPLDRAGVAVTAFKLKKRWGIMLGILLFFGALLFSQNYIWDVQVSGNSKVSTKEILLELEAIGVKKWSYIPYIDFREKKQLALLRLPEVSWLSLNISGCRINVVVAERTPPPPVSENEPCDIIAAKTGQIRHMEVYGGVAVKKRNYTVTEGEVIVSGTHINKKGVLNLMHSNAKIIAEVQFEKAISVDLEQVSKEYTGKVKKRSYLSLLSVDMPLFFGGKLKGDSDFTESEKPVKLLWFETPMTIRTKEYKFYAKKVDPLSFEQAVKVLEDAFKQYELAELADCVILNRQVSTEQKEGAVTMKVKYIAEQDIAKKQAIAVPNE